jgi:hypothetical protein
MKTLLTLTALAVALLISSCANNVGGVVVDGDCILYKTVKDGQSYYAGACLDGEGKVDRLKFRWENGAGIKLRATVSVKNEVYSVDYWVPNIDDPKEGIWVGWSSKSGVVLGLPPQEVSDAIKDGKQES